ncbi:hypothetical protein S6a_00010 [Klebsiella phage VLCpiS6a]|nr:hypothetical protein S6a_00010 [Klebsiella phage VLCpiS6a]
MARATKIKHIHIVYRNGRWTAVWQDSYRRARVVRHVDSPEHALIALLASELLEPRDRRSVAAHASFQGWLINNGLMDLRRRLLFAKRDGWDDVSMSEAVRVYREWRREQTSGTSLGLGE